jgi:hypothetical protein
LFAARALTNCELPNQSLDEAGDLMKALYEHAREERKAAEAALAEENKNKPLDMDIIEHLQQIAREGRYSSSAAQARCIFGTELEGGDDLPNPDTTVLTDSVVGQLCSANENTKAQKW